MKLLALVLASMLPFVAGEANVGATVCTCVSVTDVVTATVEGFACQRDVHLTSAVCGWHQGERWVQTLGYNVDGVPVRWRNDAEYALSTWGRLAGIRFVARQPDEPDTLRIEFGPLRYGILGQAYYPCAGKSAAGKITISSAQNWDERPSLLRQVLLHELGHALGLGHSEDERSIMYPSIVWGQHFILQSDVRALRKFYQVHFVVPSRQR